MKYIQGARLKRSPCWRGPHHVR